MKKFIKKLHLYVALVFCLPLILQGLTGSILVFEHEISDFFLKRNHVFAEGEKHSVSEIISVAQKEIPQDFSPNFVKIDELATVRFSKKLEEKFFFLEAKIDPVSLEILQIKNPKEGFFAIIKKFHTNLLISGELGRNIVGSWGLAMLFMLFTGLILWYPKKDRPFTFKFKFSSVGKKFHRDLHVAVGFWTLIFVVISSFSGVYLAFPKATSKMIFSIFPGHDLKESANRIKVIPTQNYLKVDEVIALANDEAKAEEKFISVMLPTKLDQPFRVNFSHENYHDGEPQTTIFVDQYQKKIIEKRDPKSYSSGEKITTWQHAIHTGKAFGLWWKISIFLTGFLPLLFSVTGIIMWLFKKLNWFKTDAHTSGRR